MTNPNVAPSVTWPSPLEYALTVYAITNVTNDSQAVVTCPDYEFSSDDIGATSVTFKQIVGMLPLNGVTALIVGVPSSTTFVVNVNTTSYPVYRNGGVICIDTGQPVISRQGFQIFNTPFENIGQTL
jgi:hypothetical protein